jgi:hypothetical protein
MVPLGDNVEKYGRFRQATDASIIRNAVCVLDNQGYRHTRYVLLIGFQRQG